MYYPKLDVSSMVDDQDIEQIADPRRFERLQERVRERTDAAVRIEQEGGVVVLRGEVSRTKRVGDPRPLADNMPALG
jgi:hypothetical protein